MHTLAWLRGVADEGLKFRGDDPMPLHAFVDASLEIDIGDGRVRAGHTVRMAGGPIISRCSKLQRVSKGIPGADYMWLSRIEIKVYCVFIFLRKIKKSI